MAAFVPKLNDRDLHKKIRAGRAGQEKSQRKNSERTGLVNTICGGCLIGSPQGFVLSQNGALVALVPSSFFLTINDLRVRCGTKW